MSGLISKQVTVKLFFNLSNRSFYVQIGETLFMVRDTIIGIIQDREGLEIRHVKDIKEMQMIDGDDKK